MRRIGVAARGPDSKTAGTNELVGNSRLFRAIARWSDELYKVLASALLLFLAPIGLVPSVKKHS